MQYRREIDGLRALAVISVILFHADLGPFDGGFVGVDIFFVISGYLITSIIIREETNNNFSYADFYQRRIRRILPALFTVSFTSFGFGYWFLRPDLFKDFSQSLASLSLFSSNILFWKETGYFAATAEEKPLLHTWSLSVEEQFYVIFPIFLIFLLRKNRNKSITFVFFIVISSLLLSELGSHFIPTANFFLLPGRIWELLSGSLIAFYCQNKKPSANYCLELIGTIIILMSLLLFDKNTRFPSIYTILPVFGTTLVLIFSNGSGFIGRLLSAKPVVAVGLISFSLYLWHQPIFAFLRVLSLEPLTPAVKLGAIFLSLLFGYLSWRFVEKPFRRKKEGTSATIRVFVIAVTVSAAMFAVGVWGHINQGAPNRFPEELQRQFAAAEDPGLNEYGCSLHTLGELKVCGFGDWERPEKTILLIGNSHARMFIPELHQKLTKYNIRGIHSRYSFKSDDLAMSDNRPEYVSDWKRDIRSLAEVSDTLVVSMRWTQGITAQLNYFDENGIQNSQEQQNAVYKMFKERLSWLSQIGKPVFLIMPVPESPVNVPKQMLLSARLPMLDVGSESPKDFYLLKNLKAIELLTNIQKEFTNVTLMDPSKDLCPLEDCNLYVSKLPAYYDDNHLTSVGARKTVNRLTEAILTKFEND
ncbi:acyltransferase family protein [Thalassospira sp. HF15]|uniref:acyltransferase family protein n=1 Tax=Thalassospira sp. HF15 TaxID=2722755 RepID=UPI0026DCDAF4|nr:acyltransferase family protein [Thalassospira sp. HF15]